jgi:hypothetical protein
MAQIQDGPGARRPAGGRPRALRLGPRGNLNLTEFNDSEVTVQVELEPEVESCYCWGYHNMRRPRLFRAGKFRGRPHWQRAPGGRAGTVTVLAVSLASRAPAAAGPGRAGLFSDSEVQLRRGPPTRSPDEPGALHSLRLAPAGPPAAGRVPTGVHRDNGPGPPVCRAA